MADNNCFLPAYGSLLHAALIAAAHNFSLVFLMKGFKWHGIASALGGSPSASSAGPR